MMIAGTYDFSNWKEDFTIYLENNGYKPSVVKDYPRRIEKILDEEGITVEKLAVTINQWIDEYKNGKYKDINKTKHYAPSSALIKFKEFYPTLYKTYTKNQADSNALSDLGIDPCKIIF